LRQRWRRFKTSARRFFSYVLTSPWYATCLTLLILLAGVIGGLYPDDIKRSFPFDRVHALPTFNAALFWVSALAASVLFFFREWAVDHKRVEATKQLELLVRTMPPDNFLDLFQSLYDQCLQLADSTAGMDRGEIEARIRGVLQGVLALVRSFEGSPARVRYAANLMVLVNTGDLDGPRTKGLVEILRFCPREIAVNRLAGALVVLRELSTAFLTHKDAMAASPDPELNKFALPVAGGEIRTPEGRWRGLPGAPLAFMRRSSGPFGVDGYENTLNLEAQLRQEFDLAPSTILEVRDYFRSPAGQHVRSFVSIALAHSGAPPDAVLNLHKNLPGLLSENRQLQQFHRLMGPFIAILARLLGAWRNAGGTAMP
jgi:hypothetical protein